MWMGALFGRTDACDRIHIPCNLEVLEHAGAEEEEEVGGEDKEGCAPEEHELRQQRHHVPLSGACDFPLPSGGRSVARGHLLVLGIRLAHSKCARGA